MLIAGAAIWVNAEPVAEPEAEVFADFHTWTAQDPAYEGGRTRRLHAGDHALIPAHTKHRVEYTSTHPPCIWLAVHGRLV